MGNVADLLHRTGLPSLTLKTAKPLNDLQLVKKSFEMIYR